MSVGFVIVDALFLSESSTNFPSLVFFDSTISLSFDQIYPFRVDDSDSF